MTKNFLEFTVPCSLFPVPSKYLIAVKASEDLIRQATSVLRQFEPEAIQGYKEPTSV